MKNEKKKILLVEDDETISQSLATFLKEAEFDVVVASDGEEGVAQAETFGPDLILLDVMLPKLDGVSALKKIRTLPGHTDTPIFMLTNRDDMETIQQTLEGGSYDFLVKHEWKIDDVVKRVKDRLKV